MGRRWMDVGLSWFRVTGCSVHHVLLHCEVAAPSMMTLCVSGACQEYFSISIARLTGGAAMAPFLRLHHLHRLCLTPSNAGSLGLLFRRSFAHDVLDPTEKAALKVQEDAKKVSQKWDDAKGAAKGAPKSTGLQPKSVVDKVKHQAEKELNTARDMVKDIPKNTKETAQGIKEVGVDAAKAVKRDAEKLAEKVGIKEKKKSRD